MGMAVNLLGTRRGSVESATDFVTPPSACPSPLPLSLEPLSPRTEIRTRLATQSASF